MLSIIIVNFKSDEKTIHFIKNELNKITIPNIVVIVNNSSCKESDKIFVDELDAEIITDINYLNNNFKRIFVISQPENLGFAKANNLGVIFSTKYFNITNVLFTNNDIRLIDNAIVERLLCKLESLNEVALIGPMVIGLDNRKQSPEPYTTFWSKHIFLNIISPFLPLKLKTKIFNLNYSEIASEGVHYKIMGSFFIVKLIDYLNCGMMDSSTFLYGEELILSERLKRINKLCYYFPEVSILHEHSQTISKNLSGFRSKKLLFESECYYYKHYKNISSITILIGWVAFFLNYFLKSVFKR